MESRRGSLVKAAPSADEAVPVPHYAVYGGGGHGRVVLSALLEGGHRVLGVLDDGIPPGGSIFGVPVLGGVPALLPGVVVALGVGDNSVRARLAARCEEGGFLLAVVMHPLAAVSSFAELKTGAVVLAGAVINAGASVGRGSIVNSGAVVEHDVVVGDFAHVSPNATLTGRACLGAGAHLGASACVLPGIRVGDQAIVGAGAVVTRDVPAGCVAVGVPARVIRDAGRSR